MAAASRVTLYTVESLQTIYSSAGLQGTRVQGFMTLGNWKKHLPSGLGVLSEEIVMAAIDTVPFVNDRSSQPSHIGLAHARR
jgi:hypothetical protein